MPRIPVEKRRELLVEAAFRVIAEHGVEAATTRRISKEASMSLASFHYAFESRDDLLAGVVIGGLSIESVAIHAILDDLAGEAVPEAEQVPLETVLRGGLLGYLDSLIADPWREQAMISLSQYALRTPGLEKFAGEMYQRYYAFGEASLITAAHAAGTQWRTPPSELAPLVVAATDGLTLAYLNTGDRDVAVRIIDACVALLLTHAQRP